MIRRPMFPPPSLLAPQPDYRRAPHMRSWSRGFIRHRERVAMQTRYRRWIDMHESLMRIQAKPIVDLPAAINPADYLDPPKPRPWWRFW